MFLSRREFLRAAATSVAAPLAGSEAPPAPPEGAEALGPEAFGAAGDGSTDDTAAMQALFRAASRSASARIELVRGKTYLLTPASEDEVVLAITRGIHLVGNGATIRIAPGSAGFHAILGSKESEVDVSGLRIEGVVFDHDARSERAAPRVSDAILTTPRCTVKAKRGAGLAFVDNIVLNAMSTNCVEFNGDGNTSDIVIRGNRFYLAEPRNDVYFDHSTVYATGDDIEIADNHFENAGWGSANGTCAIEVHPGTRYRIRRNHVRKYHTGINVAGIYDADSRGGSVEGNLIETLRRGVAIYSMAYLAHVTGHGIDGLAIDANRVRIRNALPRRAMLGGGPGAFGIGLVPGASLPVRDIVIGAGNRIVFDLETAPPDWDSLPAGVSLGETEGEVVFENIRIASLEIVNPPLFGIMIGGRAGVFKDCSIDRPLIVNPGSTARPDAALGSMDYRSAIWVAPHALDGSFRIEGARIVDNLATSRMVNAIAMQARISTNADVAIRIEISVTGARTGSYLRAIHKFDNRLVPLVHVEQNIGPVTVNPGATFRRGSTLLDRSTGRVRRVVRAGAALFAGR